MLYLLFLLSIITPVLAETLPYRFVEKDIPIYGQYRDFIPYDYNHDGIDEIIIVSEYPNHPPNTALTIFSQDGQMRKGIERIDAKNAYVLDLIDNPRDENNELWLTWQKNNEAVIASYKLPDFRFKTSRTFRLKGDDITTVFAFRDLPELPFQLLFFGADRSTRYIRAIDFDTMELIWEKPIALQIDSDNSSCLITSSDDTLIVFGTTANDNGVVVDSMSDSLSALIILDTKGELVDYCILGNKFTAVNIVEADIDGDGWGEIIVTKSISHLAPYNLGGIWIWKPDRKPHLSQVTSFEGGYEKLIPYNLNVDSYSEFITIRDFKNLETFSLHPNYHVINSLKINRDNSNKTRLQALIDFQKKGEPWLVITKSGGMHKYYNLDFKKMAEHQCAPYYNRVNRTDLEEPRTFCAVDSGQLKLLTPKVKEITPFIYEYKGLNICAAIILAITLLLLSEKYRIRRSLNRFPAAVIDANGRLKWKSFLWEKELGRLDSNNRFSGLAEARKSRTPMTETISIEVDGITKSYQLTAAPFRSFLLWRCVAVLARDITFDIQIRQTAAWVNLAQRMAHKIRTPLSTIMMSIRQMQTEYRGKLSPTEYEKADNYAEGSISELKRLRDASKSFMQFLKMEAPKFVRIEVREFLEQFLRNYKMLIPENVSLKVELDSALYLSMDSTLMTIAMENVLDNAIRAMGGEGTLRISCILTDSVSSEKQKVQEKVIIEIEDTGCGMPQNLLKKIFDPYFTQSEEGTGLGLFVVRRIVEDHKGCIRFKSTENIGTTVIMEFPSLLH